MKFFDLISSAVSAVVGVITKVADVVVSAFTAPSIASIATAGLTVAAVGGVGFLAYKFGKKIFNFFKNRSESHTKPENILEKSLKAAAERCTGNSGYALEDHGRSVKEVLADTFSNRKHSENKDVEYDDSEFNKRIDAAMKECAESDSRSNDDVYEVYDRVIRENKGKKNVKSAYNGRYSRNYRYPIIPSHDRRYADEDAKLDEIINLLQKEAKTSKA